jgi:hypothetical protein
MRNNNWKTIAVACILASVCLVPVFATRYTILYVTKGSVTIGKKVLKPGDWFSDKDIDNIVWKKNQCIKVRNEDTKRQSEWTERNIRIDKSDRPSLSSYLAKRKGLYTRSYVPLSNVFQIVDTLAFSIGPITKEPSIYRAVWDEDDFKVRTTLTVDNDNSLYLTRRIFGNHRPRQARVCILKYNLQTNSAPDSLGWLVIDPLPIDE